MGKKKGQKTTFFGFRPKTKVGSKLSQKLVEPLPKILLPGNSEDNRKKETIKNLNLEIKEKAFELQNRRTRFMKEMCDGRLTISSDFLKKNSNNFNRFSEVPVRAEDIFASRNDPAVHSYGHLKFGPQKQNFAESKIVRKGGKNSRSVSFEKENFLTNSDFSLFEPANQNYSSKELPVRTSNYHKGINQSSNPSVRNSVQNSFPIPISKSECVDNYPQSLLEDLTLFFKNKELLDRRKQLGSHYSSNNPVSISGQTEHAHKFPLPVANDTKKISTDNWGKSLSAALFNYENNYNKKHLTNLEAQPHYNLTGQNTVIDSEAPRLRVMQSPKDQYNLKNKILFGNKMNLLSDLRSNITQLDHQGNFHQPYVEGNRGKFELYGSSKEANDNEGSKADDQVSKGKKWKLELNQNRPSCNKKQNGSSNNVDVSRKKTEKPKSSNFLKTQETIASLLKVRTVEDPLFCCSPEKGKSGKREINPQTTKLKDQPKATIGPNPKSTNLTLQDLQSWFLEHSSGDLVSENFESFFSCANSNVNCIKSASFSFRDPKRPDQDLRNVPLQDLFRNFEGPKSQSLETKMSFSPELETEPDYSVSMKTETTGLSLTQPMKMKDIRQRVETFNPFIQLGNKQFMLLPVSDRLVTGSTGFRGYKLTGDELTPDSDTSSAPDDDSLDLTDRPTKVPSSSQKRHMKAECESRSIRNRNPSLEEDTLRAYGKYMTNRGNRKRQLKRCKGLNKTLKGKYERMYDPSSCSTFEQPSDRMFSPFYRGFRIEKGQTFNCLEGRKYWGESSSVLFQLW